MNPEKSEASLLDIPASIADAMQHAKIAHHRVLLVLSGSSDWCRQAAMDLMEGCTDAVWIGQHAPEAIPSHKVRQLLGSEYALAVLDVHDGLHPDALAAVCGTVVAGGMLLLLTPSWDQWLVSPDPDYERLSSYPYDWRVLPRRFIAHLQESLDVAMRQPGCLHLHEQDHPVFPTRFSLPWPVLCLSEAAGRPSLAQQQCLSQLVGHEGVSVLLAGRGYGKSALLGFVAQQWLAQERRVLLVAPSRAAAASVFRHAGSELVFSAPDMLLQDASITADVLLIDEAAAIPQPMLLALLQRFPQVLLATTTDGYEGTGQGFVLRFLRELDQRYSGWQHLQLDAPVRWAVNDPLQNWLYRALLLDAKEPLIKNNIDLSAVAFECVEQSALLENSGLLGDMYGLLRSAHYRTTPDDLRFLLDAPQLFLYRLVHEEQTIAVALLVEEGSIDDAMAAEITASRRRPRGHLLVQTLAVHMKQSQYLQQRVVRVVRIAVHTQYQNRGLGSQLLQEAINDQKRRGVKIIGSSFSAAPDVLAFWQRNGFELARVGHRRQAASAAPSALVLKTID
ncbi:MAG TPA: GNAT family N-acetyltransferase [Pseudomonadales bacterium]|nr:GNAT family N-acetyltransferase [Pseudomonadales bacterium]